ncbi:hypothetical protein PoB_002635400 [Plakobranchus ocellatus]|uniref:Uncharacterized protein n=1 Tax=Plakobranchus ocellatus TaxID=259542 RepID=A0AAV4A0Y2_9GAST|nr:hypothetical protein PoB_002635400 [Plakobranchus ocellatus]
MKKQRKGRENQNSAEEGRKKNKKKMIFSGYQQIQPLGNKPHLRHKNSLTGKFTACGVRAVHVRIPGTCSRLRATSHGAPCSGTLDHGDVWAPGLESMMSTSSSPSAPLLSGTIIAP